jgi:hypothetical protein
MMGDDVVVLVEVPGESLVFTDSYALDRSGGLAERCKFINK